MALDLTITTEQANAACIALSQVIKVSDVENADTWHGGLGSDLCEFCEALVILRAASSRTPTDCLRP